MNLTNIQNRWVSARVFILKFKKNQKLILKSMPKNWHSNHNAQKFLII